MRKIFKKIHIDKKILKINVLIAGVNRKQHSTKSTKPLFHSFWYAPLPFMELIKNDNIGVVVVHIEPSEYDHDLRHFIQPYQDLLLRFILNTKTALCSKIKKSYHILPARPFIKISN